MGRVCRRQNENSECMMAVVAFHASRRPSPTRLRVTVMATRIVLAKPADGKLSDRELEACGHEE